MFDLSVWKILALAVIALIVFGPEQLPGMAAQAGRMVRELRRMADGAKSELQDSLGPEFSQFDLATSTPGISSVSIWWTSSLARAVC